MVSIADAHTMSEITSPTSFDAQAVKFPPQKSLKKLKRNRGGAAKQTEEIERLKGQVQNLAGANKELNCQIEQLKQANYLMKTHRVSRDTAPPQTVATQTESREDPFLQSLATKLEALYQEFKPFDLPGLDYRVPSWQKCHKAIEGLKGLLITSQRARRQTAADFRVQIKPKW
jgi:hypothetical protein